jgi:PAS domain-containing protein
VDDSRFLVPPEASQKFVEVAHGARICWRMLSTWGDPVSGSNFAQVDRLYPFEKVSERSRHYISAALEHLIMWADFAAPFKFHPEQTVNFTMRPTMALARAALESASQAVWLMDTRDPVECVQRHLRLIRWDLQEHRKSYPDTEGKERVKRREAQLIERVAQEFTEEDIRPPATYLWVIRQACRPNDLDLNAERTEQLWRAMSGAAHGMYWTNVELADVKVGEEYEPGQFRTALMPNPDIMVEALETAFKMTQYGVFKYLTHAGADLSAMWGPARQWLADRITLKEGAAPDARQRLTGGSAEPE